MTVQRTKEGVFVISADLQTITIKIVASKVIHWQIVFIVDKKVILQDNVLATKRVFTGKEDPVSVVVRSDTL